MSPDCCILEQQMRELGRFPFARVDSTRCSVRSRQVFSFSVGASTEKVLFIDAFHGMEWITATILLRFTYGLHETLHDHVPLAGEDVTTLLQERGLYIIPYMSPGGVTTQLYSPERR